MRIEVGDYCQHINGDMVLVEDIVRNYENDERFVLYCLAFNRDIRSVCPYATFTSKVDSEKFPDAKQEYLFQKLTKEQLVEYYFKHKYTK